MDLSEKRKSGWILFAVLLLILVAVFGRGRMFGRRFSSGHTESSLYAGTVMLNKGKWPENEYTADLPMPDTGTVSQGWIDPDKRYCYVELEKIDPAGSERYLAALKKAGFTEVRRVSEKTGEGHTTVAVNLSRGDVDLSISYLNDLFCMDIHRPENRADHDFHIG